MNKGGDKEDQDRESGCVQRRTEVTGIPLVWQQVTSVGAISVVRGEGGSSTAMRERGRRKKPR